MNGFYDKVALIWDIANLLRGAYKPPRYGDMILPLTVLRRRDCVLEATKAAVLAKHERPIVAERDFRIQGVVVAVIGRGTGETAAGDE